VGSARWPGERSRPAVAAGHHDLGAAAYQSIGVGADYVGAYWASGKRVAGGCRGRTCHESTSRQRWHYLGQANDIGRQFLRLHIFPPAPLMNSHNLIVALRLRTRDRTDLDRVNA
jgi:hypothetical protein